MVQMAPVRLKRALFSDDPPCKGGGHVKHRNRDQEKRHKEHRHGGRFKGPCDGNASQDKTRTQGPVVSHKNLGRVIADVAVQIRGIEAELDQFAEEWGYD